jgi:hypothetical protein
MAHAAAAGDAGAVLRTRVLAAACEAERGALREADRTLKTIVAEAQSGGFAEATGLALHGRAHVAFQRGRFGAAVRHAYAALRYLNDPMARDRALGDIAAGFAELGVRSAARDAHMIVAATTQEPFVRWTALINLMELAALDRMEPVFEQYRRELAGAELPPRLAAYFHLYAGAGTWAFHRIERARSEYARAFAVANEAGLAQVAEQASDALARLDREGRTPEAKAAQPPPRGTTRVAAALAKMSAETVPRGRGGGWT